jgi:hypothetical protein
LWGFALFTYSNERYEDNILPTGLPFGTPEDALDCAAGLYLGDRQLDHEPPKDQRGAALASPNPGRIPTAPRR